MSDTEEYVQPPINVPFTTPMVLAHEPPKDEPAPFESGEEGLREAAKEREDNTPEPVAITVNDAQTGKSHPANETLSAEQAGRELARYRGEIADQKEQQSDQATREFVDHIQGNAQNPDLQPVAQPEQQQAQPQPQHAEAQPAHVPEGIDPEIVRELEQSPRLREALRAEAQQIEAAKQTYSDVVRQNAQAASAALFIAYPELQGVPTDQLRTAIQVMASQNPQRAAEAVAHIQQISALVQQWQDAQTAQHEQAQRHYQQQFNEFAKAEDAKVNQLMPELSNKEASKKLGDAAVTMLRNVGFSDQDLSRAYNGEATVSLRDHRVQLLLAKAARYDAAMADTPEKLARNIPNVMRPGVSGARADEFDIGQLKELSQRLGKTGNVKDAARLLMARRANKG